MRYILLSCISSLLFSSVVYAADCITSFDQSCFSHSYDQQHVEDAYTDRQQQMEEERKRTEAYTRARVKAEQEQARAEAEWRKEKREEERLRLEAEKVSEMRSQTWALDDLRGEMQSQGRALEEIQRDIRLRDLSR